MKSLILYLLAALLAISVQASLLYKVSRPDIVLVLVCFYALKYGQVRGMAYGMMTGFMLDSASGVILGPNMLSKAIAGFFLGSIMLKVFYWNIYINTALIGLFSLLDIFLVYICLEIFTGISFIEMPVDSYVMQVVYTTIAGLMFYPFLNPDRAGRSFSQVRNRI